LRGFAVLEIVTPVKKHFIKLIYYAKMVVANIQIGGFVPNVVSLYILNLRLLILRVPNQFALIAEGSEYI